ncbi:MAG: peroxiredoxin family protein [Candidatus Heimdallarchaeaceae archaeon]|jgi:hypothetical protein
MKKNPRKSIVLIFVLVISLQLLLNFEQNFTVEATQDETDQDRSIITPTAGPDFNITDVTSGISYNLSDFLGKPVLLQFGSIDYIFNHECIPILCDLYRYYTEDMFQLISIAILDDSEPLIDQEEELRDSRDEFGYHWIVGFDYKGTILDSYAFDYLFVQFVLINPSGGIVWHDYEPPINIWPEVLEKFQIFLPDDTTDPQINEFTVDKFDTEFSIYAPAVDVYANLTDDRYVKNATLIANIGSDSYLYELELSEVNDIFEVDETVTFLPSMLYGETQIDYILEVADIWNNTVQSSVISLDVADYVDMENPTIERVGFEIIEVDENTFTTYVYAAISDDLLVIDAQIELSDVNGEVVKTNDFVPFNDTHMKATLANVMYVEEQPRVYSIKITVKDVAGKTSDFSMFITEEESTEESSISILISFLVIFSLGSITSSIKRK